MDVAAEADLGGTLFSRNLPLLGNYKGPAKLGTRAGVETEVSPVEVVLAIDVSSSMSHVIGTPGKSRMDIVKDAAKTLVDILRPNTPGRVAVGVVPWHMTVRLADATATDWSNKGWARYPTTRTYGMPYECNSSSIGCTPDPVDEQLPSTAPEGWKGCLDGHRMGSSGTSAANPEVAELFTLPSSNAFSQAYYPSYHAYRYDCWPWDSNPWDPDTDWPSDASSEYGCYDPTPHETFGVFTAYYPPQYGCEDTDPTIFPLSTNPTAVTAAIDGLSAAPTAFTGDRGSAATKPHGQTYSAHGIVWGQRLLLSSWRTVWGGTVHPVDPDSANGKDVRKVIVLLTDGEDSICGDSHSCEDSPIGISRTDACTQAKNAGIEIFVIAAMRSDQISSELGTSLEECATQSDDPDATYVFLDNATPTSLRAAFDSITSQLRVVRRTH